MTESNEILEMIKGIMLTQKATFPSLYTLFLNAISIDDNIGGGTPLVPDFEFTVPAGAFFTALAIPYSTTRRFKAKNLSPLVLQWGLSDLEGGFTNLAIPLAENATSTLLSTTLGASGDFLLFYNPTPTLISIELTVLED